MYCLYQLTYHNTYNHAKNKKMSLDDAFSNLVRSFKIS
ncbi:hypothetical protein [Bacillus velezensis]